MDPDKKKYRELKRTIKKRGNRHRRRELQRALENPNDVDAETDQPADPFGGYTSSPMNGMDKDSKRNRHKS